MLQRTDTHARIRLIFPVAPPPLLPLLFLVSSHFISFPGNCFSLFVHFTLSLLPTPHRPPSFETFVSLAVLSATSVLSPSRLPCAHTPPSSRQILSSSVFLFYCHLLIFHFPDAFCFARFTVEEIYLQKRKSRTSAWYLLPASWQHSAM